MPRAIKIKPRAIKIKEPKAHVECFPTYANRAEMETLYDNVILTTNYSSVTFVRIL